jgi:hypothetical protein
MIESPRPLSDHTERDLLGSSFIPDSGELVSSFPRICQSPALGGAGRWAAGCRENSNAHRFSVRGTSVYLRTASNSHMSLSLARPHHRVSPLLIFTSAPWAPRQQVPVTKPPDAWSIRRRGVPFLIRSDRDFEDGESLSAVRTYLALLFWALI